MYSYGMRFLVALFGKLLFRRTANQGQWMFAYACRRYLSRMVGYLQTMPLILVRQLEIKSKKIAKKAVFW